MEGAVHRVRLKDLLKAVAFCVLWPIDRLRILAGREWFNESLYVLALVVLSLITSRTIFFVLPDAWGLLQIGASIVAGIICMIGLSCLYCAGPVPFVGPVYALYNVLHV
jgi:hypothetical protein